LNSIYTWVNTIIVAVVFVTFIDILMPSGSIKKYAKLVLGLLVMTIILQPVLTFLKKDYSLSGYSFKIQSQMDTSLIQKESEGYSQKQQESVSKLYKENLEKRMEDDINRLTGQSGSKVSLVIAEDVKAQNFGEIKKVTVYLKNSVKTVEKVGKVEIGDKKTQDSNKNQTPQNDDLKNKISALYNIDPRIIEIKYDSQQ
jgi:stage III sporulation protein AF